jgi:hypothetical protein
MRYVHVPMKGPRRRLRMQILGLLESDEPVFVHCKQEKDRTGTVIAGYYARPNLRKTSTLPFSGSDTYSLLGVDEN